VLEVSNLGFYNKRTVSVILQMHCAVCLYTAVATGRERRKKHSWW